MENKTTQPKPINKGIVVFNLIQSYLDRVKDKSYNSEVLEQLFQRYEFGLLKYGQPLMSDDGRDSIQDINEELLDAIQYTIKAKYNKCDLSTIKKTLYILNEIVEMDFHA
jgi:hypothetical protein